MKNNRYKFKSLFYASLCLYSFNTIKAATVETNSVAGTGVASTLETPTQVTTPPRLTMIHINGGDFINTPIRRGGRNHSSISLVECNIERPLDRDCFQNDSHLTIISFKKSKITFAGLEGKFGENCPSLQRIDLTDTIGITLKEFVEVYASPGLLDLILTGKCKLTINCAPEDLTTPSAPSPAPTSSSTQASQVYTPEQIQSMIRAFRSTPDTTSSVWWLISTVTFGAVAAK